MSGMNYDYGSSKSDSKEGEMARKTLIAMARDLYNLYIHLNDEDDLPQWCHYKLAKSEDNLRTVADYLINKITKHCLDNNVSHNILQKEIASSLRKDFINEGFLDVFSSSKNVSLDAILNHIKNDANYNSLGFFIEIADLLRQQYLSLNELTRLSRKDYQALVNNNEYQIQSLDDAKINAEVMSKILEKLILDTKSSLNKRDESLRFKSTTTSARKKKKGFFSKLFGESTETVRRPSKKHFVRLKKVLVISSRFANIVNKTEDEELTRHQNSFTRELIKYSENKKTALNIIRAIEITIKESRKCFKKNDMLFQKNHKD